MYKLEYLPIALSDMLGIVKYISQELKNPIVANSLSEEFVKTAESLVEFPYSNPCYTPVKPLKHEYRKITIKNYLMFYWVDESEKTVTVARVIYGKRDYGKIME